MTTEHHGITASDSIFLHGDPAWHRIGTPIPHGTRLRSAEVAAIAHKRTDGQPGHWDVREVPAGGFVDGRFVADESSKALVRDDNGAILSIVGKSYATISVARAFAAFDPLVEAGILTYETAGSFRGGERIWILAKIAGVDSLDLGHGDKVIPYVFLSSGFDGKTAATMKGTGTRVVCLNTHRLAMLDGIARFRVIHKGDVGGKLDAAIASLDNVRVVCERQADSLRAMAAKAADDHDLARYVAAVWQRPIAEVIGDKTHEAMRDWPHLVDAWDRPRGGKLPTTDGTVLGLYQAVTQFLSHGSPSSRRDASDRMESLQFNGAGDRMTRAEVVADVLASVGLGRAGLTWDDLQDRSTSQLATIAASVRAA